MKRPNKDDAVAGPSGLQKRRKTSNNNSDDEDFASRANNKIYNIACRKERPDELFRKDLISQMKVPDSVHLDEANFWPLNDTWKPEWERGVQVPVNSTNMPLPHVWPIKDKKSKNFKLPKKFIRTTEDKFFSADHHVLIDTAAKVDKVCKYDLDDFDVVWLKLLNDDRLNLGLPPVSEETMEICLEDFETQCKNRLEGILKTEEGLGIEYDENVNCDVCRAPDCEEGNEMVFCDSCNICVHQACYGITAIPEGSWICMPCTYNVKPSCVLCPNIGGAMKSTPKGTKWAHVNCALWVPEVSIGCPEKMEPVTKLSNIPSSRWALLCSICKERSGACIQCSVKQCKIAYHVTCAFESGFSMEMKSTTIDSVDEGVKMQSFCSKHCPTPDGHGSPPKATSPHKTTSPHKKSPRKKEIKTEESKEFEQKDRLQKIQSLESKFHRFVSVKDTADGHDLDIETVDFLYFFWVLKRRANFNKPLLITDCVNDEKEKENLLKKQHGDILYNTMKKFVHVRQDLERVRNLCYMVSRKEKIYRLFMRSKKEVIDKMFEILTNKNFKITPKDSKEIRKALYGTMILERFFAGDPEPDSDQEEDPSKNAAKSSNPYAKSYVNSVHKRSRRRTTSQNDPAVENFDSESNEMPTLVDCQSEENPNSEDANEKREPPTFINSRLTKAEDENDEGPSRKEHKQTAGRRNRRLRNSQETQLENTNEPEMPNINSEVPNMRTRRHSSASNSGTGSEKSSVSLSDKENINALAPLKIRKSRATSDSKLSNGFHELIHPKLEMLNEEDIAAEMNNLGLSRNFLYRNTRYPTRNRPCSSDVPVNGTTPTKQQNSLNEPKFKLPSPKQDQAVSPTNGLDSMSPLSSGSSTTEICSLPTTPKRGRGRPRKIKVEILPQDVPDILPETLPEVPASSSELSPEEPPPTCLTSTIKNELIEDDSDLNSSDVLSDSPGFKMSLRHTRESPSPKKRRGRKLKTKHLLFRLEDPGPSSYNGDCSRDSSARSASPEPDDSSSKPVSIPGSPERIVIRLRKETNGESWKTDSSSSESFRMVNETRSENSMSEFPSVINFSNSMDEISFSGRHRYPMRERSALPRSAKLDER